LKTPLLSGKPNEPPPDRFSLPGWWPHSTPDGPSRSYYVWWAATCLIVSVIWFASGEWLWALVPLAVGTLLTILVSGGVERLVARRVGIDFRELEELMADDDDSDE
jgi:uncharacterized membrane protein YccC